jgi:hypothetical protein
VQLEGFDPDEVMTLKHPKLNYVFIQVARWKVAAHNYPKFDHMLISLLATQQDRIKKPEQQPGGEAVPAAAAPAGAAPTAEARS